ncbi:uncharacterized protein LOC128997611 [Macrosteles quadrilineatus]|uniref:uncharacterized protein LOC128997611 n=1 Tax=Macrosteles quadrilineatus TaxID=74068 RepID=UPI0023E10A62|nr:uncharacterized protein LOC128997611 [Macrosteles quadrilineatus]
MMIKEFLESKCRVTIITRPRKWGKTVNMDMIQRFFEVETNNIGVQTKIMDRKYHKLFQGGEVTLPKHSTKVLTEITELKPLKIANDSKTMKRLGMIPVLRFNLSSIFGANYQKIEDKLKQEMKNLYAQHRYLRVYFTNENRMLNATDKKRLARYYENNQLDTTSLIEGLYFLSRLLFEHYRRKIIVLVEEFDAPFNHAEESFLKEEKIKVKSLLVDMFKELPENWYMKRTLITGTLPWVGSVLFPNSSMCVRSIHDVEYSDYFGFTDSEVDDVLHNFDIPTDKNSTGKMRYWYREFTYGGKKLYNPLDIMGFASNQGRMLDYWVDSGRIKSLEKFLVSDRAQDDLLKLLEDQGINKTTFAFNRHNEHNDSIFYNLLFHNGYLNCFNNNMNHYVLKIPNQPIRNYLVDFKTHWVCEKYDIWINDLYDFVGCLITSQLKLLKENLDSVFDSFKNSTLRNEEEYHTIMGNVLSRLLNHNFIFSNKDYKFNNLFHLIIPRSEYQGHTAFVLEYAVLGEPNPKMEMFRQLLGLAQYTLERIDSNLYGPEIVKYKYVDQVVTIAIAFYKAQLEISCKVFKQEPEN